MPDNTTVPASSMQGDWNKDAEKLFLLGLSEGLIVNREHRYRNGDVEAQSFHLKETFRNVYLLTDKVAPSIIRQCISNGMESNIPEIRACCKLLNEIKK